MKCSSIFPIHWESTIFNPPLNQPDILYQIFSNYSSWEENLNFSFKAKVMSIQDFCIKILSGIISLLRIAYRFFSYSEGFNKSCFEKSKEEIELEYLKLPPQIIDEVELMGLCPVSFQSNKNQYSNVLANESTRFKLEKKSNFYYNANWVLSRQAIAAQGPLKKNKKQFWKMVWHSNSSVIVMLTNFMEKGIPKCHPYWPCKGRSKRVGQMLIQLLYEKNIFNNGEEIITKRKFQISKNNKLRKIYHFHLENWPDHGKVKSKILMLLVKEVEKARREKTPIISHCSAGIGRTGTFLAVYGSHLALAKGDKDPSILFKVSCSLRHPETGRNGMIQTKDQYRTAYKAVKGLFLDTSNCIKRRVCE